MLSGPFPPTLLPSFFSPPSSSGPVDDAADAPNEALPMDGPDDADAELDRSPMMTLVLPGSQ